MITISHAARNSRSNKPKLPRANERERLCALRTLLPKMERGSFAARLAAALWLAAHAVAAAHMPRTELPLASGRLTERQLSALAQPGAQQPAGAGARQAPSALPDTRPPVLNGTSANGTAFGPYGNDTRLPTIASCEDPPGPTGWFALQPWGQALIIASASLAGLVIIVALGLWCCGCCLMAGAEPPIEAAMAARKSHLGFRGSWGGHAPERASHAGGAPPGAAPPGAAKGASKGGAGEGEAGLRIEDSWLKSVADGGDEQAGGEQAA